MKRSTAELIKLDDQLAEAIQREGALSRTRAKELTGIEEVKILDKSFARLVLQDRAVWVAGLPKQGIFFTKPENRGRYGLPLLNAYKPRVTHAKTARRRGRRRDLYNHMEGWGEGTVDDLAGELGWSRDSIKRNLEKLEAEGLVVHELLHDGHRGRPPKVWSRTDETTAEDEADVDFSKFVPRGT